MLSEGLGPCADREYCTTRKKAMQRNALVEFRYTNLILNKPRMVVLVFCTLLPNLGVWNIFVKKQIKTKYAKLFFTNAKVLQSFTKKDMRQRFNFLYEKQKNQSIVTTGFSLVYTAKMIRFVYSQ
jgi:hypothetical protein